MNTFVKRLAQVGAIYAAKKLWNSVDEDAAREFARGVYTTSPSQWEQSARDGALGQLDNLLNGVGLTRAADARHSRLSSTAIGVAAGVTVGVAGTVFLLKSETGQNLVEKLQSLLTTRQKDEDGEAANDESIVAAAEDAEDSSAAGEAEEAGNDRSVDAPPNARPEVVA